jgi:hypothetical protein
MRRIRIQNCNQNGSNMPMLIYANIIQFVPKWQVLTSMYDGYLCRLGNHLGSSSFLLFFYSCLYIYNRNEI